MEKYKEVRQASDIEEREVHISIDYGTRTILLYTNHSTVMNRLGRLGYKPYREETIGGKPYSRSYEFPMKEINKVMQVTLYK